MKHLPENVTHAYNEARITFSAGAYTAGMLMFRNILAYVAIDSGSNKKDRSWQHVNYLSDNGRISQTMKNWPKTYVIMETTRRMITY